MNDLDKFARLFFKLLLRKFSLEYTALYFCRRIVEIAYQPFERCSI